jgi:hypothetical protein
LISTGELLELKLRAQDGEIGSVRDLIFHDLDWSIRELIADTGGWLFGRRVGIDPDFVLEPDLVAGVLPLELTKEQVKNSPAGIAKALSDESVDEDILAWNQSNALAGIPENLLLAGATVPVQPLPTEPAPPSPHLRSLDDVNGYEVWAGDNQSGTLTGFLIDPIAWDLPLALVQLDGVGTPVVLLPTRLIADLGWPERIVHTYLEPSVLRNAPVYDPRVLDERAYLPTVADYYTTAV